MNLKINEQNFEFFESFNVSLRYDSVASSFSLKLYFDPENPKHVELLRPATRICRLEHNGDLLITGYTTGFKFLDTAEPTLVTVSGYSLPGVLEDCQLPLDYYPLESIGVSLLDIAQRMVQPFGLGLQVDGWVRTEMEKPFEKTTADPFQTIKQYLSELASQRGVVLSHSADGSLLFTRALVNDQLPEIVFGSGTPGVEYDLQVNLQGMHSQISVQQEANDDGGNVSIFTVPNPYQNLYKTAVLNQTSGDDNDTITAAKMARAKELQNIKLQIKIDRWDKDNRIIRPNSVVAVANNPRIFITKETKFFIEAIDYIGDAEKMTATLHCVLPEAYNLDDPINIFKQ